MRYPSILKINDLGSCRLGQWLVGWGEEFCICLIDELHAPCYWAAVESDRNTVVAYAICYDLVTAGRENWLELICGLYDSYVLCVCHESGVTGATPAGCCAEGLAFPS